MFDNTYVRGGNVATSFKINAITGTIVKNYRDSFFKRFSLKSDLATQLFDQEGAYLTRRKYCPGESSSYNQRYREGYYIDEKVPVVILQMMMCGENEVLCELIYKEDFDKLFGEEPEQCNT